jgi:ABC-type glycerol-3-phosphate transport system substrate-binding protein
VQVSSAGGRVRWKRRTLSRNGLVAAAALLTGGTGPLAFAAGPRAARPGTQDPKIVLNLVTNYQGTDWGPEYQALIQRALFEPYFYTKYPGVYVNALANAEGNAGGEIAAELAGNAPDVLSGCCTDLPTYLTADALTPLTPLLRRDNINLDIFSPGHVAALTSAQGVMALPSYDGPQVLFVHEDLLDALGLAYPEPGWTIAEAVKLWESIAGPDSKAQGGWRYGATLQWYIGGWGGYWLPQGWGGNWIDSTRTRPLFDSPACVTAISWIVDLLQRKVALARSGSPLGYMDGTDVTSPHTSAMFMCGSWNTQFIATNTRGMKWNYYPMPVFPAGPTTMVNVDFLALNAATRYPELAWELLKFVAISKEYHEFNIKTSLITPARVDMWDYWEHVVQEVAPTLRGKNLHYYHDATQYSHGHIYFKYNSIQANNLIGNATNLMGPPGRADVATTLQQLQRQIAALQASGAQYEAEAAKARALDQAYIRRAEASTAPIEYPPPPRTGPGGVQATPAPRLVTVSAGRYTLTGAGAGITGSADGGTYACQAERSSRATFTCRLVSIAALKASSLNNGAKVGLMVRSDLSAGAATVGLEVAMSGYLGGVHFSSRIFDGANNSDNRPASAAAPSGLIGPGVLLANGSKPAKNYLLRPVWLRLVLDVDRWIPFTSLDGTQWTQAHPAIGAEFLGAWVGLFVTSHQSGHYIQAVFDNVSGFRPDTFVQIGTP